MKKILITLFVLIIALPCYARMNGYVAGCGAGGASCSTASNSCDAKLNSDCGLYSDHYRKHVATKFIVGAADETVCGAKLVLKKSGASDPSHSYNVYVYSNSCSVCDRSDDDVGTVVGTGSTNSVTWNDLPADYPELATNGTAFTGINAALSAGGVYWLVVKTTGASHDITNHGEWSIVLSGCAVEDVHKDADGSGTWTSESATAAVEYVLYK